jgi:ArsR family transcriptional regulator
MKMKEKTDRVDLMFRAFSDRTRLRILNLLRGGETCVCDLVDVIGAPQPKVSRHLAYLRRAGLVVARKEGLWQHYSLTKPKSAFHGSLLNCLACCFQSVPELKRDVERLGRSASCCGTDCCT